MKLYIFIIVDNTSKQCFYILLTLILLNFTFNLTNIYYTITILQLYINYNLDYFLIILWLTSKYTVHIWRYAFLTPFWKRGIFGFGNFVRRIFVGCWVMDVGWLRSLRFRMASWTSFADLRSVLSHRKGSKVLWINSLWSLLTINCFYINEFYFFRSFALMQKNQKIKPGNP